MSVVRNVAYHARADVWVAVGGISPNVGDDFPAVWLIDRATETEITRFDVPTSGVIPLPTEFVEIQSRGSGWVAADNNGTLYAFNLLDNNVIAFEIINGVHGFGIRQGKNGLFIVNGFETGDPETMAITSTGTIYE